MSSDKIIRRTFFNKKNKQLTITLSKKQLRAADPTIKFGETLFVEIKLLRGEK